jgi:hypothetical protein
LGFLALVPTVGCAGAAQQHFPPYAHVHGFTIWFTGEVKEGQLVFSSGALGRRRIRLPISMVSDWFCSSRLVVPFLSTLSWRAINHQGRR